MSSKATKIVGGIVVLAAIGYGAYYYANQTANDVMVQKVNNYLVENKLICFIQFFPMLEELERIR